jgi:O-acetyl-ADP-ribose deacetylase (regulator of RNase III)
MELTIIKQDLFEMPLDYQLVHCISADYKMGAGIALEFKVRYERLKPYLMKYYPLSQKYVGTCIRTGRVFNLITKEVFYKKPTYKTMESALISLRQHCVEQQVKKLAMPKIGCGLDRLKWGKVQKQIEDIFEDLDIEIVVCEYEG